MELFDYVILGGGVAGLCAAKRLLELGIQPLVIEANNYPVHKVCGEFLSPSSLAILKQWNIHPVSILQAHLHTSHQNLQFIFPHPAGGLSHWTLDTQLAEQLSKQGAILLTQTKVLNLSPAAAKCEVHQLKLSSGETIKAKHLLIASGRIPGYASQAFTPRYVGIKSHFSEIELDSTLHMFAFKGAYLGIAPIENGRANLACLAKIESMRETSPKQFIEDLIVSHPLLRQLCASGQRLFDQWMEVFVPEFGLRSTPEWMQTYWIGDAAGTIPPASGNGLSLAIESGCLAAEFAAREDAIGFKHAWKKQCALQIACAKGLHRLFLNPAFGNVALRLGHWFPWIVPSIFNATRGQAI